MQNDFNFEIFEQNAIDTLTGEPTTKGIRTKSGMRVIYISTNTLVKIIEFVNKQGGILPKLKGN